MTQFRRLHPLERRVLQTIQAHDLIPPNSTVVVAVSGGVDSLALMYILHALAPRLRCTLHIATLDHMLRGEAGAADAAFVAEQAAALGLECRVGSSDVQKKAKRFKLSIETAARNARYSFLKLVARRVNATFIALAHHADDQAETVLMRLLRGTSVHGLAAMRWRVDLPVDPEDKPLAIIRPMLNISRQQLEAYCNEKGLQPREDKTNLDTHHLRNRVRLEVLPYLRSLNRHVDRALDQLAASAAIEDDYLDQRVQSVVSTIVQVDEGYVHLTSDVISAPVIRLDHAAFRQLHSAIQHRLVVWAYRRLQWTIAQPLPNSVSEISFRDAQRCVNQILQGVVGKQVEIAGKVILRIDYEYAYLERDEGMEGGRAEARPYKLLSVRDAMPIVVPGTTTPSGAAWRLRAEIVDEAEARGEEQDTARRVRTNDDDVGTGRAPSADHAVTLALPMTVAVTLRGRREGDRFAPKGMDGHTQKIKQWMIDRKIPAAVRDHVPLLDVDGQIAAILWGDAWTVAEPFRADRALGEGEQYVRFTVESG